MTDFDKIQSILSKKKRILLQTDPFCVFCTHGVTEDDCTLAHLIRRSEALPGFSVVELQTMDLNIGLAHLDCHELFDNCPELAVHLPGIHKVLDRVRIINVPYYNRLMNILGPYWPKIDNAPAEVDEGGRLYLEIFAVT
jgi:hypothetical protein